MFVFFFNDTATTEIYTLSLHDALPISLHTRELVGALAGHPGRDVVLAGGEQVDAEVPGALHERPGPRGLRGAEQHQRRSEEHTSELQSRQYLVCRLLLEKKKIQNNRSR